MLEWLTLGCTKAPTAAAPGMPPALACQPTQVSTPLRSIRRLHPRCMPDWIAMGCTRAQTAGPTGVPPAAACRPTPISAPLRLILLLHRRYTPRQKQFREQRPVGFTSAPIAEVRGVPSAPACRSPPAVSTPLRLIR